MVIPPTEEMLRRRAAAGITKWGGVASFLRIIQTVGNCISLLRCHKNTTTTAVNFTPPLVYSPVQWIVTFTGLFRTIRRPDL